MGWDKYSPGFGRHLHPGQTPALAGVFPFFLGPTSWQCWDNPWVVDDGQLFKLKADFLI